MSDSLWPQGLYSTWDSPGQSARVGSLFLLQGIFPTQGLNPGLPHCRWILYQLSYQCIKKQRHHFADKSPSSQSYGFSSSHVWMWELGHRAGWAPKNWCFQIVVQEKTLESLLDNKESKPVHPKGNHLWILIGRTYAEALILWPRDANRQLSGKILMLRNIDGMRRRGQQGMRWLDTWADSGR